MAKRSMPKKPSRYTSSTSLITSASAIFATVCAAKISPAGARSTSRVTPMCCCESRTRGRSSPPRRVNCARIFGNAQNARRCSPVSDIPITEKLLLNAGGWQALRWDFVVHVAERSSTNRPLPSSRQAGSCRGNKFASRLSSCSLRKPRSQSRCHPPRGPVQRRGALRENLVL